jgi:hypothetical protein
MRVVRRTRDLSFLYTTKTPRLSTRPFKYNVPCVYDCGPLWIHRRCFMLQHSTDPAAGGTISAKSFVSELHPERIPAPLIDSYTITPLKACNLIVSRTTPVCKTEYLETSGLVPFLGMVPHIYDCWMKFRFRYIECKQTCDRDLLVALIGVATGVNDMFLKFGSAQDEIVKISDLSASFIAGMWRQYLLVEIR